MASSPTYGVYVTDLGGGVLADVSERAYNVLAGARLNAGTVGECRVLTKGLGDVIRTGDRRLLITRNGQAVSNGIIWNVAAAGDRLNSYAEVRAVGPMQQLQRRWVQDADGQIFDGPSFSTGDRGLDLPAGGLANPELEVTAGSLLKQCIDNTVANDGALQLTTAGGQFSLTVGGPNVNVRFALRNITPLKIGDLQTLLANMNVVDCWETPTAGGSIAAVYNAVTRAGGSSGQTFRYSTGTTGNCEAAGYTESMDEFTNKLWHELGAREGSHFKNNITRDAPGVTVDDSASRTQYGVYHDIQVIDYFSGAIPSRLPAYPGEPKPWTGAPNPLYAGLVQNYNGELAFRMRPRRMVWVTPQAGEAPEPWTGYALGDTAALELNDLGAAISGSVRIHGWNAMPQDDKPEHVTLFLADDSG